MAVESHELKWNKIVQEDYLRFSKGEVSFKMIKVPGFDYFIGETPVTQELWEEVTCGGNPSRFKGNSKRPVETVSLQLVKSFITELNKTANAVFRLPKADEWLKAAKGGLKSMGYIYSGSNVLEDVAWYNDNSDKQTHPVKEKKPNEIGLYDMSGNVQEWSVSKFVGPNGRITIGPNNESCVCEEMVLMGGSWANGKKKCELWNSSNHLPASYEGPHVGFRLAI